MNRTVIALLVGFNIGCVACMIYYQAKIRRIRKSLEELKTLLKGVKVK